MLLIDYSYFPWSAEMIRWKLFDSGFFACRISASTVLRFRLLVIFRQNGCKGTKNI